MDTTPAMLRLRFWRAPPSRLGPAGAQFVVALADEHGSLVEREGVDVDCWVSGSTSREELATERLDGSRWRGRVDWEALQRIAGKDSSVDVGASCRGRALDAIGVRTGPLIVSSAAEKEPPLLRHVRDFELSGIRLSVVEDFGAA